MFVLSNIGLVILTTVFLAISFFVIVRFTSSDYYISLGINTIITEGIQGLVYSGLFVLYQIIMKAISVDFKVQIFLFGFILLISMHNYRVASYSFPLSLIYFLLTTDIDAFTYAQIISFMVLAVVFIIIDNVVAGWVGKVIIYSSGIILGLISMLVVGLAINKGINVDTFAVTMFPFMLFLIIESMITYVIKTSIEANVLYESINFVFGNFYRESIKEKVIGDRIVEDKITQAAYALLDISYKARTEKETREVLETVLNDIQSIMGKDVVLFHNGGDEYGFFMPTRYKYKMKKSIEFNTAEERDFDDPIKHLEKYLAVPSKPYKTINGEVIKVQIFGGVSIYGIQNSSIQVLNDEAVFALRLNVQNVSNRISVFNPYLYRMKVNDSYNVQSLDKTINLDNYANRFIPVIDTKTMELDYHFAYQINISETEFIGDVKTFVGDFGLIDTFERYYAGDALKKLGKTDNKIIIDYSIKHFMQDFSSAEFLRQLNSIGIKRKNLVLQSNLDDVRSIDDLTEIKKVMEVLRSEGIKFSINSFHHSGVAFDMYVLAADKVLKAEYIPNDRPIIVPDVDTEEIFSKVLDKGITKIGGPLIQTNVNINNFDKQSKIYIEELISERGK